MLSFVDASIGFLRLFLQLGKNYTNTNFPKSASEKSLNIKFFYRLFLAAFPGNSYLQI
jgi:hypothetical protein